MGYTVGRRLTKKLLREIALLYKTRGEFKQRDPSAYSTARDTGVLDEICMHMQKGKISVPQLVCKYILDKLLHSNSIVNSRKIIKPFELDIYYEEYKVAVEYNGKHWHKYPDAIKRDITKKQLCKEQKIQLISIVERNRDYESDIKQQCIENIHILQQINHLITNDTIHNIVVDWDYIYANLIQTPNLTEITAAIRSCSSVKEFQTKYSKFYRYIIKTKRHRLLLPINKSPMTISNHDLLTKCKEIHSYTEFVKTSYYGLCRKRNLVDIAASHMIFEKHRNYTKQDILVLASGYGSRGAFKAAKPGAYDKARRLKMLNELFGQPRKSKWNKSAILEVSSKCSSYNEFKTKYSHAYRVARKLNILNYIKLIYAQKHQVT
jgi:hypothetical protein